jgi:hypothetical protein
MSAAILGTVQRPLPVPASSKRIAFQVIAPRHAHESRRQPLHQLEQIRSPQPNHSILGEEGHVIEQDGTGPLIHHQFEEDWMNEGTGSWETDGDKAPGRDWAVRNGDRRGGQRLVTLCCHQARGERRDSTIAAEDVRRKVKPG